MLLWNLRYVETCDTGLFVGETRKQAIAVIPVHTWSNTCQGMSAYKYNSYNKQSDTHQRCYW